jgi:transcriptional regulator with XRE-family HTH domain
MSKRSFADRIAEAEEFARRLNELMKSHGYTQSGLARAVWGEAPDGSARNRDRISVYLKGSSLPEPENLEKLAKHFDVATTELMPEIRVSYTPEQERPELSLISVPGQQGQMLLDMRKLVSLETAKEIIRILAEADKESANKKKP